MRYAYYPGCSLTESAHAFDASTRAVMTRLGVELAEVSGWACCGASAAEPVSRLLAYALPARTLALTEAETPGLDLMAPCSACYLNLLKVNTDLPGDPELARDVAEVLAASGLAYKGGVRVRHLLDLLANDLGTEAIQEARARSLEGLAVAPYYGCQILRPHAVFDDPRRPRSMHAVVAALGATALDWEGESACCGASLMVSHQAAALDDVTRLLAAARAAGADCLATACPLCQMNLEAYQGRLAAADAGPLPVVYVTQLMALALGLEEPDLALVGNLSLPRGARRRLMRGGFNERSTPNPTPNKEMRHV